MFIKYERQGGFAGMSMHASLDTQNLPPEEAYEVEALVYTAGFFDLPRHFKPSPQGRDGFQHILSVEDREETHTVEATDTNIPEPLQRLISILNQHARRREQGGGGSGADRQAAPRLPTLKTARLVLRPFIENDAADVQRLAGAREVAATTKNIPHPYEDGMAEAWIAAHQQAFEESGRYSLAVTSRKTGELVGAIGFRINSPNQRADMGYWIGKPFWNLGLGTEAASTIVEFIFGELQLNRVEAYHLSENAASGRVMEKVGMQHEGHFKQYILKWGEYKDCDFYGLLAADYRKNKR